MAERVQVESEIKRLLAEAKSLDDKVLSSGVDASSIGFTLERHNSELVRRNVLLEQELASLSKKCSEGEELVKSLRPQLDAYKAKFVR
jgi:chromosome segregation ATPase